jgi:DNA-binding MarR family transcriptional regulator
LKKIKELRTGALLRTVHQEFAKVVDQGLESAGYGDIRSTHSTVLQPLFFADSGLTSTELADLSGMTKQSMGELVKYLEKQGYVQRDRSQKDLRAWLITLTPKGRQLMDKLYAMVTELDEKIVKEWGVDNLADLREKLWALIPIVQKINKNN